MKKLFTTNHFFLLGILNLILLMSCSKSNIISPQNEALSIEEPANTSSIAILQNNNIESQAVADYNGAVYLQCNAGPYHFTIDSLIENGTISENLLDSVFYSINDFDLRKHYDFEADQLQNLNELDFTITRNWIDTTFYFELEVFMSGVCVAPLDYFNAIDTISQYDPPFYNGYVIENNDFELKIYFFNRYIGGCLHDEMVWFYEE